MHVLTREQYACLSRSRGHQKIEKYEKAEKVMVDNDDR